MSDSWLITGGARSGKSAYAEELCAGSTNVLFIATGVAFDEEMRIRIERHRQARPQDWTILERHNEFADIEKEFDEGLFDTVVLDCVGNLLMGVLFEEVPDPDDFMTEDFDQVEKLAIAEVDALCDFAKKRNTRLIFVTNEIGMGVIPVTSYTRHYRDTLGRINKHVAAVSDNVVLMVAGIPVKLK